MKLIEHIKPACAELSDAPMEIILVCVTVDDLNGWLARFDPARAKQIATPGQNFASGFCGIRKIFITTNPMSILIFFIGVISGVIVASLLLCHWLIEPLIHACQRAINECHKMRAAADFWQRLARTRLETGLEDDADWWKREN